jgi:hypothetical protein
MPSEAFAPSIADVHSSFGLLSRQKDLVMNKAPNVAGNYRDFPMCVFLDMQQVKLRFGSQAVAARPG